MRPKNQSSPPAPAKGLLRPKEATRGTGAAYRRSGVQEKQAAERLARVVKGSGRLSEKGDARAPRFARVECKCTAASSFRVTAEMIDKIRDAAAGAGEMSYLEIELGVRDGKPPTHRAALVPMDVLEAILMHYRHVTQKPTR